jgi:type IV secretory pathway TraG/TraD family ATPase VirD4
VPGRGRQLRGHQEAPPACYDGAGPGDPAADHLARRGPAAAHRYGHRASTVLNGHRAKLLLSGQADPASLELASKLVGDEAVLQTSETTGGDGRASLTESTAYRRLLPPEALRQLKPRRALLVYGYLPPVRIRLRPWFRSRRLVSLAMAVDAAVPHPAMAVDDLAPVEVLRPTDEGEAAA